MNQILHISKTDINVDSRIRKELIAVGQLPNVKVSVIGTPNSNEGGEDVLDGARYFRIHLRSRALGWLPRAVRYFFELIEFTIKALKIGTRIRPDIVHCHDTFALPAGWLLKKRVGCRLVYDAHELESDKNGQNAILSYATLLIEKFCWKQVDMLVSVSNSIIDWYSRNLGVKPSVLVLNSPIFDEGKSRLDEPGSRESYFHEKFRIPKDHLVFVYLGILMPGRGIEICLDAFASGPLDTHVVFIGYGSLEKSINEHAERYTNIHFHEAVPHDQVVPLVRSADYGLCLIENVSLSDFFCLPNKLFEYCFARVPVLASNFPEINRLVEVYSLGICCEPHPDSVRATLRELGGKRPSRLASDISDLSWERQAERLKEAYRSRLMASSEDQE